MSLHYVLLRTANADDGSEMTNGLPSQNFCTVVSAAVTRISLEMCVDCDAETASSEDDFQPSTEFPEVDSLPHQTSLEFHKSHSSSVMTREQTFPGSELIFLRMLLCI